MGFHDHALTLAKVASSVSHAAAEQVGALERQLGRDLPESFRELLVLDAWPSVLSVNSNQDHPKTIGALASSVEDDLLVFMVENQGVCQWAVDLTCAPDPPVVIRADDGHGDGWTHGADTFSTWFLCQVLDHLLIDRCRAAANIQPLPSSWLSELQATFNQGPTTYRWPGQRNLRFSGPTGSLLLWDNESQCDWWIAPSGDDLVQLLDLLPLRAGFSGALYEIKHEDQQTITSWIAGRVLVD